MDSQNVDSHYLDSQYEDSHNVESHFVDYHCVESHYVDYRYVDSHYLDSHTMNLKREFPGGNKGLGTAFKVGQKIASEQIARTDLVTSAAQLHRSVGV